MSSVQGGQAAQEERRCQFRGVSYVNVPVNAQSPSDSPVFSYAYQWLGDQDPNTPTIVYVSGGPGMASIAEWTGREPTWEQMGLPGGFNYLFLDPRTAGCNRGSRRFFPDDSLSTWNLASDALAVLRSLKLNDYILYGYSYGTAVATLIASRAQSGEAPPPRAVVLAGTIGRGHDDESGSIAHGLIVQWEKLRKQLPQAALDRLDAPTPPLGISKDSWAQFIESGLNRGRYPLKELISLLGANDSFEDRILRAELKSSKPEIPRLDFSSRLYTRIDCAELTSTEPDVQFEKGHLSIKPGSDECKGRQLERLYDSAEWPIHASIFYVTGTRDPTTPHSEALYHFKTHPESERFLLTIPGGGHARVGEVLDDCKDALWDSIHHRGANLGIVLGNCAATQKPSVVQQLSKD